MGVPEHQLFMGPSSEMRFLFFESADLPPTFSWVPSLQREVVNGRMTNQYMGTYLHILKYLFSTGKPGSYSKRALLMKINYAR
jgi:hypothetical protein